MGIDEVTVFAVFVVQIVRGATAMVGVRASDNDEFRETWLDGLRFQVGCGL